MDLPPLPARARAGSLALLGAAPPDLLAALAAVDLPLAGALADPFGPAVRGERFAGSLEVLAAAEAGRVAAALVAPEAAPLLPDLLAAGLPVLLTAAAPWDVDLLQHCRGAVEDVPVGVLLRGRCLGWALTADAALDGPGTDRPTPVQVVVQGWGRGQEAAAGLLDLLRRWCGDVVAVCAAPAALPAATLPGGAPVAWALLTETGCTVLLSHAGDRPQVRLSFPERRLLAGPDGVSWSDGDDVPRLRPGLPVLGASGEQAWTAPEQLALALSVALRSGTADPLGGSSQQWPWPPDLLDLLPLSRTLAALEASARSGTWVELG